MAAIAWSTIENALWTWVQTTSSLDTNHVVWADQNQPAPSGPYITMRLSNIGMIGLGDSVKYAADPAPGGDMLATASGQRKCTLALECFAGDAVGARGAGAILEDVLTALNFDEVYTPISEAGISVVNFGNVQQIDGVVNSTLLEPRATVDVKLFLTSSMTIAGTRITTVNITDQIPSPSETLHIVKP